jgi:polysaccharide biosynthesis/export protein
MTSRMLSAPRRRELLLMIGLVSLAASAGCSGLRQAHEAKHIPHLGYIDGHQPRELRMVSMPPYVVEPPDELEITARPAIADLPSTPLTVQADGQLDLGFLGDVYVSGLTLSQVEQKIAQHLDAREGRGSPREPRQVSVRLANGSQSKVYYVIGTVSTPGKYPIKGNETVLDAILGAGLKSHSLPEKSYLVRPHPAGAADQVLKIDWVGIKERGDTLTNYQIFPGDRIVVPGGRAPGLLGSLFGG